MFIQIPRESGWQIAKILERTDVGVVVCWYVGSNIKSIKINSLYLFFFNLKELES